MIPVDIRSEMFVRVDTDGDKGGRPDAGIHGVGYEVLSLPDWTSVDCRCQNRLNGTIYGLHIRHCRDLHIGTKRRWPRVGRVPGKALGCRIRVVVLGRGGGMPNCCDGAGEWLRGS